jgi:DNA-binding transcriptional LysR family regulator
MGLFAEHDVKPRIAVRSGQWDFLAAMVQAGIGVAIPPGIYSSQNALLHASQASALRDIYTPSRQIIPSSDVKPRIAVRSGQWDFLAAMVQAGIGVAILPEPICQRLSL